MFALFEEAGKFQAGRILSETEASMQVELDVENARKFMKIYDALEDLDDVQNIYSNADMSPEVLAALEED